MSLHVSVPNHPNHHHNHHHNLDQSCRYVRRHKYIWRTVSRFQRIVKEEEERKWGWSIEQIDGFKFFPDKFPLCLIELLLQFIDDGWIPNYIGNISTVNSWDGLLGCQWFQDHNATDFNLRSDLIYAGFNIHEWLNLSHVSPPYPFEGECWHSNCKKEHIRVAYIKLGDPEHTTETDICYRDLPSWRKNELYWEKVFLELLGSLSLRSIFVLLRNQMQSSSF